MPDRCPRCQHPLPPPTSRDFERMPTRDREAMLDRAMVRKAPAARSSALTRPIEPVGPLMRVLPGDGGGIVFEPRF